MSVYVTSDWHGYDDFYEQIKSFLKPEDIVYFLGDACDRGPNGYQLVKNILADAQFIYILGNHESLFIKSARSAWTQMEEDGYYNPHWGNVYTHFRNGGEPTLEAWLEDSAPQEILNKLDKLPHNAEYMRADGQRVFLNHSGFMSREPARAEKTFCIWDREQIEFYDYWSEHWPEGYCVHGHTPIQHIENYLSCISKEIKIAPYWYCDNHKVDIDMGTVLSGQTCLLNLDTWEYHIFTSSQPPLY